MLIYVVIYLIPAFIAIYNSKRNEYLWLLYWVIISIIIGFREGVGADWENYLDRYNDYAGYTLSEIFINPDPAYGLLNWLSNQLNIGIYGVNLICALIFTTLIFKFCSLLKNPWLALTISIPYLIIVVGMGYTRQAVALSIGLNGLLMITNSHRKSIAYLLIALLFHKTSVIYFFVYGLIKFNGLIKKFFIVSLSALIMILILMSDYYAEYSRIYIESEMHSAGGAARSLINFISGAVFLIIYKKKMLADYTLKVYEFLSYIAIILFFLITYLPYTTIIDRISIYLFPIQIYVFSTLPSFFINKMIVSIVILLIYFLMLIIWLVYSINSFAWIPYGSLLW